MSEQTRISEENVREIISRIEHDGLSAPRDQIEALARDWLDLRADNERLRDRANRFVQAPRWPRVSERNDR